MSIISETSPKHCANKQATSLHNLNKKLFFYLSTFFLTILSLIILVWFILHPKTPQFSLKQADINQLNITGKSFLNSSIQLTLLSTNPNKNIGIYYDQVLSYASYNDQIITPETSILPFYQDHEETNLLSASLTGTHQPVDPSLAFQVQHDRYNGKLALDFKITGKLRWKVGNWVSGKYRFNVNCMTNLPFGHAVALPAPKQGTVCSISV